MQILNDLFMSDKEEYIMAFDKIVMGAFLDKGTFIITTWKSHVAIVSLLKEYGTLDGDLFIIGKKGIEYAMRGGHKGISKDIEDVRNNPKKDRVISLLALSLSLISLLLSSLLVICDKTNFPPYISLLVLGTVMLIFVPLIIHLLRAWS